MAPRKTSVKKPAPAPEVTASARKTRSSTAGKRVVPPPVAAAKPPSKKPKLATKEKGNEKPAEKEPSLTDSSAKSVIVEACKQCNQFKTRANMVKEGLENAVTGVSVAINPEKPRRGCFEVRDRSGKVFISLLDMKRPFTPMRKLDMEEVIKDIIQKIN